MSEDDETWFSEDELERISAIEVDSIATDGLVRGHDPALWTAHIDHPGLSLRHLPEPTDNANEPVSAAGWGLGPAGAALGTLMPGETLGLWGVDDVGLHLAQALALQMADGLALSAARALERPPPTSGPITPTMVMCGAGPAAASLAFLARCDVASMAELVGPMRREHDARVQRCLARHRPLRGVMRAVRKDEVLRGRSLLESLQPRLSAFVSDVRRRAEERGHDPQRVLPVAVLTLAHTWVGHEDAEYDFVRAFGSMVRHAGAVGVLGTKRCGPTHELCDAAFAVRGAMRRAPVLRLVHHHKHWPSEVEFGLEFDSVRARVHVRGKT